MFIGVGTPSIAILFRSAALLGALPALASNGVLYRTSNGQVVTAQPYATTDLLKTLEPAAVLRNASGAFRASDGSILTIYPYALRALQRAINP